MDIFRKILVECMGSRGDAVAMFLERIEMMSRQQRDEIDRELRSSIDEVSESKTICLAWQVLEPGQIKLVRTIADQYSTEGMYFYAGIQLAILEILINAVWVSQLQWQKKFNFDCPPEFS